MPIKKISVYSVVKSLIGDITPVKRECEGEQNLQNLLQHIYTTEDMVHDLTRVAKMVADNDIDTVVQGEGALRALEDLKRLIDSTLEVVADLRSEGREQQNE